ncbi:o-succinylbenzoate synthase [Tsukamurella tyrosinosolvens]|uniref:o-succinylbenzoate synthase n=1 Tax=Tsukamurella tyrosinosolvens TaxID=57704 RepID=UPI00079BB1A9|nr:o-succinylbenzoate synthase [Tsukamurella tyrosinosolvens]KXP02489.1 O-succinylbenzoate synthase [Tsukamurella tyrosinosolvens]KZL96627.1 O-succinylbenzoate synthase [Tsukamurella tyrosinosolvens]MCA4996525.1 o-succinylbenzoate synthase [Tsukamurella tyrosinosolvens]WEL93882.1 o-succinylbenzoate synthase [Tsukamurella tyrosinosolvens]
MVDVDELVAAARVVRLPMRVRFRGITAREAVVFEGPAGWGEFGPFPEYDDAEAAHWLRAGIEAAYQGFPVPLRDAVPVNATVPAVGPSRVPEVLARFPGCRVAKVKVAETGQTLAQDVARVAAVRAAMPGAAIRVDANGGWTVDQAERALTRLLDGGPLDYAEQPCATVEELAEVRRRLGGACDIAADESIRRADDPMRVAQLGAADVAVVKVAPLGGVRAVLDVAAALKAAAGVRVTVSSALDTAVGLSAGIVAAACVPDGNAAGLGTGGFFTADLGEHPLVDGALRVRTVAPTEAQLAAVEVTGERRQWWLDRLRRCHVLAG